jgi:DNA-binding transcriptional LysR family regulator
MRPSLLKTFLAVADTRNITRAAEQVNLAQSSVSDQIQQLEAELSAALFTRSRTGLELTAAGEMLKPYAREILGLMEEAQSAVMHAAGQASEIMRIGALETIASITLPQWLAAFRNAHPNIELQLRIAGSAGLLQLLERGEIDVAFCFDKGSLDGRFLRRVLAQEPLTLIASAQQGRALAGATDLQALAAQRFVATGVGCVHRHLLDQAMADAGIAAQVAVEVDSIRAIAQLVAAGAGLALVPRLAVADELTRGELMAIPWPGPVRTVPLIAMMRRRRVQPAALQQLFAFTSAGPIPVRSGDGHLRRAI